MWKEYIHIGFELHFGIWDIGIPINTYDVYSELRLDCVYSIGVL